MAEAAAGDLNDIGKQQYCDSIEGANYATSNLNITALPMVLRFGLCLPEECKQADFDVAGNAITNLLAPGFKASMQVTCPGCFPKQTTI